MRISYANVAATTALLLSLTGGVALASGALAPHSVGRQQLKNNAVISSKVRNGSLIAADFKAGQVPAGPRGAQGPKGDRGIQGIQGEPGAPAAAYVATFTNVNLSIAAGACIKGTLTSSAFKIGDTAILAPDYNGTWPVTVSVDPGVETTNGSIVAQYCNHGGSSVNVTNQTLAVWRVVGPAG